MLMEREMDKFVVNYVVNNLTRIILSGQCKVDCHWRCTRVLLHSVTQTNQGPRVLRSRIETPLQDVINQSVGKLCGWV